MIPDTAYCGSKATLQDRPSKRIRSCIAAVIPTFRAGATIASVVDGIGPEVDSIYVVDDSCPELSGDRAIRDCPDPRLVVLRNGVNLGVGGAMKQGYRRAIADGADIVVKLDADGQMDPRHIPRLIAPLLAGAGDYSKGNRFAPAARMPPGSCPQALKTMPLSRFVANRALRLVHGLATGYWSIRDPANGYTAIRADVLARLDQDGLADCFFFETDMLFRLRLAGANIVEVPLPALYLGGPSTLSLTRVAPRFAWLMARRALQRARAGILDRPERRDPNLMPTDVR